MATGEETDGKLIDHPLLADDDLPDLGLELSLGAAELVNGGDIIGAKFSVAGWWRGWLNHESKWNTALTISYLIWSGERKIRLGATPIKTCSTRVSIQARPLFQAPPGDEHEKTGLKGRSSGDRLIRLTLPLLSDLSGDRQKRESVNETSLPVGRNIQVHPHNRKSGSRRDLLLYG